MNIAFSELHIDNYIVLPVVKDKPRVLIVEFVNKRTRNTWLKAKRVKRDLLLSELLPSGSASRVYINKRSTAIERRGLAEAKKFAESKNFEFCWMIRGQIFVKKDSSSDRMKYPQDFPDVSFANLSSAPSVDSRSLPNDESTGSAVVTSPMDTAPHLDSGTSSQLPNLSIPATQNS